MGPYSKSKRAAGAGNIWYLIISSLRTCVGCRDDPFRCGPRVPGPGCGQVLLLRCDCCGAQVCSSKTVVPPTPITARLGTVLAAAKSCGSDVWCGGRRIQQPGTMGGTSGTALTSTAMGNRCREKNDDGAKPIWPGLDIPHADQ
eukprot:gene6334-biopygen19375